MFTVIIIVLLATMHLFPVLSRFDNTIKNTFKNSFFMGILTFPKTILMLIIWVAPLLIAAVIVQATPIVFMLGISAPAYLCAKLYNKTFKRFEPEEEIVGDDEWTIAPLEGEEEEVPAEGGEISGDEEVPAVDSKSSEESSNESDNQEKTVEE